MGGVLTREAWAFDVWLHRPPLLNMVRQGATWVSHYCEVCCCSAKDGKVQLQFTNSPATRTGAKGLSRALPEKKCGNRVEPS